MRLLLLLVLFFLLDLGSFGYGDVDHALQSDLFSTRRHLSWWHSLLPIRSSQRARQVPNVPAFSSSMPPAVWASKPSLAPSPAPSPMHHGYATGPRGGRHQRRTPNAAPPNAFIPWRNEGCDEVNCPDSQTPTPIGSPCGCVLPMQVELDLGVTPYVIFPLIPELEVEVAKGTYLKQSQVRIMGASADLQDLDKTVVNIFLVPLGEKFDNTTALLIYERFSRRKIPLNATLFGDYDVISIQYPGLPATPPSGSRPSGSDMFPITANVHGKSHRMNSRTIAIVVLALFALLLVCFAISYILIKWMKARGSSTMVRPTFTSSITKRSGIESFLSSSFPSLASPSLISTMAPCMLSVKTFLRSELQKATDKFSSKRFLGKGGFGEVYHGIMEDGTEIAVKKLLMREDQNRDREFIAEVEMLSRLHHRNLVKLIGICIDEQIRCVVYELVRNGSVESHLHGSDKRRGSLDWDTRMKIALGAARALAYLHEDSNPRVIHRDFKASNVLLENDFTPKVSDFGLAREASEEGQHISTRVMGTFGYVAPEYAMTGHLLVKSDVYSYGVVLLELLSGREPVDMSQPQGQENLVMWARPLLTSQEGIEQLVDPSLGGNYDFENLARVAAIASMCVHPEVTQRPFMGEVVQALKLIYNDGSEACVDCNSQREGSSVPDCEYRGEVGTDSGWWHGSTPRLTHGYASSFITMDYSSGPMREIDRPHSASTIVGPRQNRSGPLRAKKMNSLFYRLRGSMSEHGLLSRRFEMDGYWV